jgi:hypothetical protein
MHRKCEWCQGPREGFSHCCCVRRGHTDADAAVDCSALNRHVPSPLPRPPTCPRRAAAAAAGEERKGALLLEQVQKAGVQITPTDLRAMIQGPSERDIVYSGEERGGRLCGSRGVGPCCAGGVMATYITSVSTLPSGLCHSALIAHCPLCQAWRTR